MKNYILLLLIGLSLNLFSQKSTDLFMPKEIRQAYEKGTRNYDGTAGENYFVNRINYKIKVSFNPSTRIIEGEEDIFYTNNSSDKLKNIYFNLYQNLFKKGNKRDWDIGTKDLTDGVNINKVFYNGKEISKDEKKVIINGSILKVELPQAIKSNETVKLTINWDLIIPKETPIRMGTYNNDNFMIAYWFPKVAVYDDIVGWNKKGHSGSQEFYNDFGNYDVEITVPENYNVWSTAILQNSEELYTKKYLDRIKKSKGTEDIIHIITKEDREKNDILKDGQSHVWKFKSENTPDFAFAVSKTYIWDATSIMSGNKRVSINAVYKSNSKDFYEVAEISKKSVKYFTEEIPSVPYPYPQFTAFNGGGGMEFPGMINDGDSYSRNGTLHVTSHEIGHSYFPFYTGLNEQKYAWMDEGLITFFPRFVVEKYTNDKDYVFFKNVVAWYNKQAGTYEDVPLMISSNNVGVYAYRFQAYSRSSVSFYLLYKYLGKEKFTKGLQLFIERWKGKHPTPYDFFFTFNEVAGEDLAWFWKPWFFEIGYADLSIKKVYKTEVNKTIVIIENKTGFPVPVELTAEYIDGTKKEISAKMDIWKNGRTYKINISTKGLKKIILNTKTLPDAYVENNIFVVK